MLSNFIKISHLTTIPEELNGKRLDQAASMLLSQYSRTRLKAWIKSGDLLIDKKGRTPNFKVTTGQTLELNAELVDECENQPQNLVLAIVFADTDIIIINKPVGMVVHPGAGNRDTTLLNALLYHFPELAKIPRAGIIHRLDKDTSGLMIVARNLKSHTYLVKALRDRAIKREYVAIAMGKIISGGVIDAPIGRHATQRILMTVTANGKPALTHYRVIERFRAHTYVHLVLDTGRTHQIRVHLAHINHPIVGDRVYGGRLKLPKGAGEKLYQELSAFSHQALHAKALSLKHPVTQKELTFTAEIPTDMQRLLETLRADLK